MRGERLTKGQRFRQVREALHLTQTQLSMVLGFSGPARISEYETGKRTPSTTVLLLMDAFMKGYRPDNWPKRKRI